MRIAAAAALVAMLLTPSAWACSMSPVFRDGGRYLGGDLVTQIAERAQTIQIVRAVHRMPISVGSPRSERVYAFQFDVVATLAQRSPGPSPGPFSLDGYERVRSVPTRDGFRTPDPGEVWLPPEAVDRPGDADGYRRLQIPGPEHLSRGSCDLPMYVELGEEFVVLRQADGQLYAFDRFAIPGEDDEQGAEPLPIYFSYMPISRSIDPTTGEMIPAPPLVRIESRDDAFLVRLRAALNDRHRLRH